jgi:superfamily II DNA/RNA helicase
MLLKKRESATSCKTTRRKMQMKLQDSQIFYQALEVLRKVWRDHDLSAGLMIGGKDLKHETERIININILICTPGQLLQHMDETICFHATNLYMLVLGEADRIMDMGFANTMNAITENLSKKCHTLLFSDQICKGPFTLEFERHCICLDS